MNEFIKVGEKEYPVIKSGRAQAAQVLAITKWLSKYGVPAISGAKKEDFAGGFAGLTMLSSLIEYLTTDALIELFIAVTGCTKEEAEVHFDIIVLVDAIMDVYEGNESIRRLLERFFSTPSSEEGQPQESSTASE